MGKKFLPRFFVCVSKRQFFIYTVCALEMKKISKARVQTPNDIKSLSLFLYFFLASRARSLCPHIVFRICALRTVFDRVFKTLQVTIFGSIKTSPIIPRTPVSVRVSQTLELTIHGSTPASQFIPRTTIFVRVF